MVTRPVRNRDILEIAAEGARAPASWTQEDLVDNEGERIVGDALMALVAAQMPRRNGSAAGARALALDKKVSRKTAQLYLDIWRRLTKKREAPKAPSWDEAFVMAARNPEARRAGATVLWKPWIRERGLWIPKQRSRVAAFALREGLVSWGARRVMLYDVEEQGIDRMKELMIKRGERKEEHGE